jgi:hypothetical protein
MREASAQLRAIHPDDPAAAFSLPVWYEAALLAGRIAERLRADGLASGGEGLWGSVLAFLESQHQRALREPPVPGYFPLDETMRSLALSGEERLLLVLAGMVEEHEGYGAAFTTLHPRGESRPTFGLFAWLAYCELGRDKALRLLNESTLFSLGAVRLAGDGPLPERSLRLAEGLWPALHGIDAWPEGVAPLDLSGLPNVEDDWIEGADVRCALDRLGGNRAVTVLVRALQPAALRARAQQICLASPRPALLFEGVALGDAARFAGLLAHCFLRRSVPVILIGEAGFSPEQAAMLENYPLGAVLAGVHFGQTSQSRRPLLSLEASPLSTPAQCALWRRGLPELAEHAEALASRFPLWPDTVRQVRRDLLPWLEAGGKPDLDHCVVALKARVDRADENSVRRVTPTLGWDDLVLPEDRIQPLREAVARLELQYRVLDEWGFARHVRGRRGLRVLFSGLPGTGKTLAAEVVAKALNADLLIVDLARLVSKWIGETEKNLASVFDQAEATGAVLFFDEADALFGKRTEVSDAHDRYANIESAYLLARLERFDGVAILATNLRQNMDKAFLRRFEFALDFPEPGARERALIWRLHLPERAPLAAEVDLDHLAARYPLSGAMIRNAALGAAFLAAAEGNVITRAHIERALCREHEKSGRVCPV